MNAYLLHKIALGHYKRTINDPTGDACITDNIINRMDNNIKSIITYIKSIWHRKI